jgi:hypothetical protein
VGTSPKNTVIRSLRVISGCALVGTVTAGALFGGMPAILGIAGAHEIGAIIGAGVGVFANAKHLI